MNLTLKNIHTKPVKPNGFFLENISFSVPTGSVLTLVGESGAGKTTLLDTIAGFIPVSHGKISWRSMTLSHLPPDKRQIGYIFQNNNLLSHKTLYENLVLGLSNKEHSQKKPLIDQFIKQADLKPLINQYPETVSGGEQQRIAIGRCLVHEKEIMLFDEPFTGLDKQRVTSLIHLLRDFINEYKKTAIVVTHQIDEALVLGDTLGIMKNGRLLQYGKPQDVYQKPRSASIASFLGPTNFLRGVIKNEKIDTELGVITANNPPFKPKKRQVVMVLTRPDDYMLVSRGGHKGIIRNIRTLGMQKLYDISVSDKRYAVIVDHEKEDKIGDTVQLKLKNSHPYTLFKPSGSLV